MKTICFIVPSFPTTTETFVINHILQAKSFGYNVIVITKHLKSINESSQKELLLEHDILNQTYHIDYKIPSNKIPRLTLAFFYIIKHFKYWLRYKHLPSRKRFSILPFKLAFYCQFKNVSVFHIQFATAGMEIAIMKSIGLLSGHIVTTFHGYDAHFESNERQIQLKRRYELLLKESRYLTVNTPYLLKKIELLGGDFDKIKVIPMGVDLNFFQNKMVKVISKQSTIKLISIGRLIELKGFEYAIRSVKILIDKGYNVQYCIVGTGEMENYLLELISNLSLTNYVFLVGSKNQKEIRFLLEEHHIFLMSSITDLHGRAEAQGVVTAEAQAMGLPIVAFNCGGVPYTIIDGETGFLISEKDTSNYAQAIVNLIESPSLYSAMNRSAVKYVIENYSRDKLALEFFKLYN
uniref:glycosyltransferase n=2 Tax=Gelidibacter sp. TaxID=2018083 RepID=UPI00404AD566